MQHTYSFEKLEVWQNSRQLVKKIYNLTSNFPNEETFGLTSQIRRATISIVSNLAEGSGRTSYKEKIRFIEIAYSSALEVYCQLVVAYDLNYITIEDLEDLKLNIYKITKMLSSLRRSMNEKS